MKLFKKVLPAIGIVEVKDGQELIAVFRTTRAEELADKFMALFAEPPAPDDAARHLPPTLGVAARELALRGARKESP